MRIRAERHARRTDHVLRFVGVRWPAHRPVARLEGGQVKGIALRELPLHHEHLEAGLLGRDGVGHGRVCTHNTVTVTNSFTVSDRDQIFLVLVWCVLSGLPDQIFLVLVWCVLSGLPLVPGKKRDERFCLALF